MHDKQVTDPVAGIDLLQKGADITGNVYEFRPGPALHLDVPNHNYPLILA
jgi:hypothetical protein